MNAAVRSLRQRTLRAARRTAYQGVRLYGTTLHLRGRMTAAEILAMRAVADRSIPRMYPGDPDVRITPVRQPHAGGRVQGEWVEAPGAGQRTDAVVLYVHGGGFVFGSPATHRALTGELSRRLAWPVFSLDYRLAPRHRFPAAPDDVLRAYDRLLGSGLEPGRIVVAGDSAGGHLALGLPPRAIRAGLPVPAGVVAFSPVLDTTFPAVATSGARVTPDVGARALRALMRHYDGDQEHVELALGRDELVGMPPVLIQIAEGEFCAPDALVYAEALRQAGGDVELRSWPRTGHVFQIATRHPKAREALDDVTRFAQRVTG